MDMMTFEVIHKEILSLGKLQNHLQNRYILKYLFRGYFKNEILKKIVPCINVLQKQAISSKEEALLVHLALAVCLEPLQHDGYEIRSMAKSHVINHGQL